MNNQNYYEHKRDSTYPNCFFVINNSNPPHFHSAIELIYVERGTLNATVGGKNLTVNKGELLVVPSYDIHLFEDNSDVGDIVLIVPIGYLPKVEKTLSHQTFSCNILSQNKTVEIAQLMKKLINEPPQNRMIERGYIYLIMGYLFENSKFIPRKNQGYKLIQNVLQYMEENYKSPVTLKTVARHFGVNETSLSRSFNAQVGCSFPFYLGKLRSQNAAYLIENENFSIIDAAMESGFESMRSFYRIFKQNYPCSPKNLKDRR